MLFSKQSLSLGTEVGEVAWDGMEGEEDVHNSFELKSTANPQHKNKHHCDSDSPSNPLETACGDGWRDEMIKEPHI